MNEDNIKDREVMIELKSGDKYFGVVIEIDNSKEYITFVILKNKYGKINIINDCEITRIEVLR